MIDPSILLDVKPINIESPQAVALGAQNLQNLATQNQIQQGDIRQQAATLAATEQQNQQRQIELANQQAINAEIAKHVTVDPATGKPVIDHNGVVAGLTQSGKGMAALQYQQHATDIQKGVTALQEEQAKLDAQHVATVASGAGAIVDAPDPAKGTLYHVWRSASLANHQIDPNEWPADYDPALLDKLKGYSQLSITPEQRETNKRDEARTKETQRRNDILDQREQDYRDSIQNRADAENWTSPRDLIQDGHQILVNTKTGEWKVGPKVDTVSGGAGGERAVTPTAQANLNAKYQSDFEKNSVAEVTALSERNALKSALDNGSLFLPPGKNKPVPFSTMKDKNGNPLGADEIAAYREDMRQRMLGAQSAAETAIAQKNQAYMNRNPGQQPQVSTEQAIGALRQGIAKYAPPSTQPEGPPSHLPQGHGQRLDPATAKQFLSAAGGDKQKARQMAAQAGWQF